MTFLNQLLNIVSTVNSTTSPLGASGVFTGTWELCRGFAELRISFDADVEGANCDIQFSPDGSKIERTISVPPVSNTLQTNFGGVHTLNPILPYYRVIYTNGATPQTTFNLTTTMATSSGDGLVSRSTQVLNKYNDVRLIRAINDVKYDRNLGLLSYQSARRAFGFNDSVGNGSFETIWPGVSNYVFPQTAETLRVAPGGNAADTDSSGSGCRKVRVEYLDANFEEQSEILSLSGVSASAATTGTAIRVLKAVVVEVGTYGGSNIGDVVVENTISNNPLAYIPANLGRSQAAVYTIPANKTAYVTKIIVSVGQADSADVRMYMVPSANDVTTPYDSVASIEWDIEDFSGAQQFTQETYLRFFEMTDIYFEAIRQTGSGSARISVDFEMILVDN